MVVYYFIQFFVIALNLVTSWIPRADTLPFGMDDALSFAMSYWYGFIHSIWMLQLPWKLFLWYLGIRLGLYVLKLFLGHRLPAHL